MNFEDVDIEDILDDLGNQYTITDTHYIITCPECNSRKMYVSKYSGVWICFKCDGKSESHGRGNFYNLLKIFGYNKYEVKSIFSSEGVSKYCDDYKFEEIKEVNIKIKEDEGLKESISIPIHFKELLCTKEDYTLFPEAYNYLLSRGIDNLNIIRNFRLMYSKLTKRIISPFTEEGLIIGYQGRDITDRWKSKHFRCENYGCELFNRYYYTKEDNAPEICPVCKTSLCKANYPKTLNSKNLKKTIFFNQDNIDWDKTVTIVEGPFDCMKTPNSIALLGKFLNKGQVKILKEKAQRIVIYMDGDNAGDMSAIEIYRQLEIIIDNVSIVCTKEGSDPGQLSIQENKKNIQNSISLFEWGYLKKIII